MARRPSRCGRCESSGHDTRDRDRSRTTAHWKRPAACGIRHSLRRIRLRIGDCLRIRRARPCPAVVGSKDSGVGRRRGNFSPPLTRMRTLVFTDLDGTLLDENYSWRGAESALAELRRLRVPLILCTSKTRAEVQKLRTALKNNDPYSVENGGMVVIPKSSPLTKVAG